MKSLLSRLAPFLIIATLLGGCFYKTVTLKKATVGQAQISIEIADNDRLREKGLSDRKNLPEGKGMLFLFPAKGRPTFWMSGMDFPLDFLWINNDSVVEITDNVQPPNPGSSYLPTLTPKQDVDSVLEVNAGFVQKNNIKVGDTFHLEN